jgi:hypothetical protein
MTRWVPIAAVAATVLVACGSASAGWSTGGSGSGYSGAKTMPAGNAPTASVSGRNVTVSWTAAGGAVPVDGYVVKRYDPADDQQPAGADCSGTVAGTSCTEHGVEPGDWRYTVAPARASWHGVESSKSGTATVAPAALMLDSSSISSLPSTITGQISGFKSGQTVSFRLDDPSSGPALTGSITPSPVPCDGTASVSVTVPASTANGSHTVYAVGDQGDVAGAPVTVAVPATISTSAWDVRDASSATESNASEPHAFSGDSRTATSGGLLSGFDPSRYLQLDYNSPLPPGLGASGASFDFDFAAAGAGQAACFYFEVRRISTGNVIGTHGDSGNPVACQTGTAIKSTATPLPEVDATQVADDLRVRVFVSNSLLGGITRDRATVSGTANGAPFRLYETKITDATGLVPNTTPWGLATSGDGAAYQSAAAWPTSFSASRYLKLTFPAYVPSGAPVSNVTFRHSYRPATLGTTCFYFEVYSQGNLIGTHGGPGNPGNPVSCNSSTSNYVTDAVSLPEVSSAAKADDLSIRLYLRNSTGLSASQHDLAELQVTYVP